MLKHNEIINQAIHIYSYFYLLTGDRVVILAEFGPDWYFGHTLTNEAHKGIFPKDYVHLIQNDLHTQEPLVDEINSSLKEWNTIMKSKYVNDEAEVIIIQGKINLTKNFKRSLIQGPQGLSGHFEMALTGRKM